MQTYYSASREIYAGMAEISDFTNWNEKSNVTASRLACSGLLRLERSRSNVGNFCATVLKSICLFPS